MSFNSEFVLNTYFCDMEKIDKEIVTSAKELGKWLNNVAYRSTQKKVGIGVHPSPTSSPSVHPLSFLENVGNNKII